MDIVSEIKKFFPQYRGQELEESIDGEEYTIEKNKILPLLQTLLFENRIVGVQVEHRTRHFFTSLLDHKPELIEEEKDGEIVFKEPKYEAGSYLKQFSHLNLAPVEPSIGNLMLRRSQFITLIFYTGTTAVEVGTHFQEIATVSGEQVIQVEYPLVAKIRRKARAFRAKTFEEQKIDIRILDSSNENGDAVYHLVDLSARGLAFCSEQPLTNFEIGKTIRLIVDSSSKNPVEVAAYVRHLEPLRVKRQTFYFCGVLFDLETRALASEIEKKFASLQRAFIRSLREQTAGLGIDLKLQ